MSCLFLYGDLSPFPYSSVVSDCIYYAILAIKSAQRELVSDSKIQSKFSKEASKHFLTVSFLNVSWMSQNLFLPSELHFRQCMAQLLKIWNTKRSNQQKTPSFIWNTLLLLFLHFLRFFLFVYLMVSCWQTVSQHQLFGTGYTSLLPPLTELWSPSGLGKHNIHIS